MSEFLKPEVADTPKRSTQRRATNKQGAERPQEKLVLRAKMPDTLEFWSDSMLANAAFNSYNVSFEVHSSVFEDQLTSSQDNFRLTCLSAMQQRARNVVPRRPNKAHWDYVLDEAEWLRRDFRQERVWKMSKAKKRAEECVKGWNLRVKERGRFVEDSELRRSKLG